jgi:hypothetical protein
MQHGAAHAVRRLVWASNEQCAGNVLVLAAWVVVTPHNVTLTCLHPADVGPQLWGVSDLHAANGAACAQHLRAGRGTASSHTSGLHQRCCAGVQWLHLATDAAPCRAGPVAVQPRLACRHSMLVSSRCAAGVGGAHMQQAEGRG